MSSPVKISVWVYAVVLAAAAAAGGLAACRHMRPSPPVSADSSQGKILTAALGYHWYQQGIRKLPRIPGRLVYHTVLIDPGHGGKDPGARGISGGVEKDIVLDVGLRLQKILDAYGVRAFMTRTTDEFLTLEERVEMIRDLHPDLFLSLHANSSDDESVSGIEVFFAEDENYWEDVHRSLIHVMLNSEEHLGDMPDEIYRFDSSRKDSRTAAGLFAKHLLSKLTEAVGTRNRGVKRDTFYVLSEASAPSILVELGFVTHPEEGRKLTTGKYRQALAAALAESLLDYGKDQ